MLSKMKTGFYAPVISITKYSVCLEQWSWQSADLALEFGFLALCFGNNHCTICRLFGCIEKKNTRLILYSNDVSNCESIRMDIKIDPVWDINLIVFKACRGLYGFYVPYSPKCNCDSLCNRHNCMHSQPCDQFMRKIVYCMWRPSTAVE